MVGLDLKQPISVAKGLAEELDLDIEFYEFDIDKGLLALKQLIGLDTFDHVFALSIWAHCDETILAQMINYYTDKICWFEGHNATTYGDTKSKMDIELEKLLDLPYHEYIGETSDVYDTVIEANHDYENKKPGGNHLIDTNSYRDGKYNFNGKFSCFLGDSNSSEGIKLISYDPSVTNLSDKKEIVERIFRIQSKLSEAGFSSKPLEIIDCHDSNTFYYGIKMENLKGKFVQPSEEWIQELVDFCKQNNLSREGWDIRKDCVPKNCIEVDGKVYLVDIDYRWTDAI